MNFAREFLASIRFGREPARRPRKAVGRSAVLLGLIVFLAGCASTTRNAPVPTADMPVVSSMVPAPTEPISTAPYRIARGDELNLKFFYTPELNTIATVRSDGRIAVPLVGELLVEGRTTGDLAATIQQTLASLVKRPDVSINVQGTSSQRVFVGGEVTRPGVQPLIGPLSIMQAVMVAEGVKESARTTEVVVVRRGERDERQVLRVDLQAALDGTDTAGDLLLQPYDVVVVPRKGISNVNLWVDQYIRRNLPIGLGVSYSINRTGVYP